MADQADLKHAGLDATKAGTLVEHFRRQQSNGVFPGGQLVVMRRGVLAIDEAVGVARGVRPTEGESPVAFTRETQSCLFSAGKPLVAVAIAMLESRGLIDVCRPVAAYFPEFGTNGKADITVLDVLLHRSGLWLRDIERDYRRYGDWEGVMARIAAAGVAFPRGTLAYQPLGFGWILGEIVRRVTTLPIERFIERELLAPAGLKDLRLGVPVSEIPSLARSYWVDKKPPRLGGEVLVGFEEAQNSVEQLTAVLPGAGLVGTARSLAAFYAWLLAGTPSLEGTSLVRPEVLSAYVTAQTRGTDRTVRIPMVLGRGFGIGWFCLTRMAGGKPKLATGTRATSALSGGPIPLRAAPSPSSPTATALPRSSSLTSRRSAVPCEPLASAEGCSAPGPTMATSPWKNQGNVEGALTSSAQRVCPPDQLPKHRVAGLF